MINLPNIEGKIWNIEYKINEIWQELVNTGQATLSLNSEGPCASGLGLYELLDDLCKIGKFDKKNITILTCNQLEKHDDYQIKRSPPLYIHETQNFYLENQQFILGKNFTENCNKFGLFIGRSNWIRLWLAGAMNHYYPDDTLLSFHWSPHIEFHRTHLGLDEMLKWNSTLEDIDRSNLLLKKCPIIVDSVESYPVLSPKHLSICSVYHNFFLEIVCETYFNGNSFYPTEKIWRPLICKTPFILHGPVEFLSNLRKCGFETFDHWWDESYDDYGHDRRILRILEIVQDLSKKTNKEIHAMHQEMKPVLEHNLKVFLTLTPQSFTRLFNYDR